MNVPAFQDFETEPQVRRQPSLLAVYAYLRRDRLAFDAPCDVKKSELVFALHMRPASVIAALNWLVTAGYLIEHARGPRGVRRFTLAYRRSAKAS